MFNMWIKQCNLSVIMFCRSYADVTIHEDMLRDQVRTNAYRCVADGILILITRVGFLFLWAQTMLRMLELRPLFQMLHDILGHLQWHPPLISHFIKSWPCYQTGPYYRFWRYYLIPGGFVGHLKRVRLANRGRLLFWIPDPVRFGTCICSNLSWTCHVYGPFEFRTFLGTSIVCVLDYVRCLELSF